MYNWMAFCDICGQRYKASQMHKLSTYTGKGNLIVCKHDVDAIDHSFIPYRIPTEKNVPWTRINHTNTDSSSPTVDMDTLSLCYFLSASQDDVILTASQDDAWLQVCERI